VTRYGRSICHFLRCLALSQISTAISLLREKCLTLPASMIVILFTSVWLIGLIIREFDQLQAEAVA
jgi:hypothetical protein